MNVRGLRDKAEPRLLGGLEGLLAITIKVVCLVVAESKSGRLILLGDGLRCLEQVVLRYFKGEVGEPMARENLV